MNYASIGPVALHFPERAETNDDLQAEFPDWDLPLIHEKTGIFKRHVAAEGETASDLGVAAAEKLFEGHGIDRGSIDFLLLCTQTPDYPLPTTACLIQERLKLPTGCGALDFNLGCSGFVYGLALADGLIRSGAARRILFITAETYTKYIHPTDRALRTIFGDGAAATLIESASEPSLSAFTFGTDGSGGNTLLVNTGGARPPESAMQSRGRWRWPSRLYMDGPTLIDFTVEKIPQLVTEVLRKAEWPRDGVDLFLMHQATRKMLDLLRAEINVPEAKFPLCLHDYGNTVSSTLPVLIHELRRAKRLQPGMRSLLVGFGVGLSWGGCAWKEVWPSS